MLMPNEEPGPSPEDARMASLEERLRAAQREEAIRTGGARKPDASYQAGNRVLADLLGGLLGGAAVGWVLDRIFGTSPGFLVGLVILGIVAGFWNIIKRSSRRS
ncbi:MAG: hypothetical protein AVDCRST_MAG91-1117 [uncultured Sphingomonadaceae bacterium]|uniref:ATP synthase protein I n=1 Tax=uncultured Sphingomonadaceae bacterium TaxID=169976 RepID=A0A6J4SQR0_9SPHN|nr:MAG: hypothetical protein AVDCRST_MAG91-1117 [uncultured Sphingomonadaceae bacterium]